MQNVQYAGVLVVAAAGCGFIAQEAAKRIANLTSVSEDTKKLVERLALAAGAIFGIAAAFKMQAHRIQDKKIIGQLRGEVWELKNNMDVLKDKVYALKICFKDILLQVGVLKTYPEVPNSVFFAHEVFDFQFPNMNEMINQLGIYNLR